MKKIFSFLLMIILLTGCSITSMNKSNIDTVVQEALYKENNLYNTNRIGYRYYLPRTFTVVRDSDYNESFISNGKKYYLYVDIVSYYNKSDFTFVTKPDIYYSALLSNGNNKGYLEITKVENSYLVELMYNYSKIEVLTNEENIKNVIIDASNILSSIKYNNSVINNLVGESKLNFEEVSYDIFKPKNSITGKTFLDYVEEYENNVDTSVEVEDSDIIN